MDVAQLILLLDELAQDATKLAAAEPAFVQKLNEAIAAVKLLLPTGTVQGLVKGAEADYLKAKDVAKAMKDAVDKALHDHFS